jgi:hypothetical protein
MGLISAAVFAAPQAVGAIIDGFAKSGKYFGVRRLTAQMGGVRSRSKREVKIPTSRMVALPIARLVTAPK